MLKIPRPITFELAFFAAVAAAAPCETSHTLVSPWERGLCLTLFGVPFPWDLDSSRPEETQELGVQSLTVDILMVSSISSVPR